MLLSISEYHEHVERTFDSYCKRVIRNEAIDTARSLRQNQRLAVSTSEMPEYDSDALISEDQYDIDSVPFHLYGYTAVVHDSVIAEALRYLPPKYREVLLLSFFLDMSISEIADILNTPEITVRHRLSAALTRLQANLEAMPDE